MSRRYLRRLLAAFVISSSCFGATVYWYNSGLKTIQATNRSPIAYLEEKTNEVQRKPLAHMIWESLAEGERLYTGEAIRTAATSQARIFFLKTGTTIDLSPDSLIVLKKNQNGIALNFLKGNVFVKNTRQRAPASGSQALTLTTGNSQVDLTQGDVNVAKTNSGNLNLEVLKGHARLKNKNGSTMDLKKDSAAVVSAKGTIKKAANLIKIIGPQPEEPVFIDLRKNQSVLYRWEKLPAGYTVFVERGRNRHELTRATGFSAPGESGKLRVPQHVGRFYWRLVAVPTKPGLEQRTSPLLPGEVLAKRPPALISPEPDEIIVLKKSHPQITMRWVARSKLQGLVMEMAVDPALKHKESEQYLDRHSSLKTVAITRPGRYYWRITGFMKVKGKLIPVASEVRSFYVRLGVQLLPPQLHSPMDHQHASYEQSVQKGVAFTWSDVPGVHNYKLSVEPPRSPSDQPSQPLSEITAENEFRWKDLKPGAYRWFVQSISDAGQLSKPSPTQQFVVDDMPVLQFAQGPTPQTEYYVTKQPQLQAHWQQSSSPDHSWRYRFAPHGQLGQSSWHTTDQPYFLTSVAEDGNYDVQVQALDQNDHPVAISAIKQIAVRMRPTLPPPRFATNLPNVLTADPTGHYDLKWQSVRGAKAYKVEVRDQTGKVVRAQTVTRTIASLQQLTPGNFEVVVKTVDTDGRVGAEGEPRQLKVPTTSKIAAPVLKRVEIK